MAMRNDRSSKIRAQATVGTGAAQRAAPSQSPSELCIDYGLVIKPWRRVLTWSFRLVLPASTLSWSKAVEVDDKELMEAIEIVS